MKISRDVELSNVSDINGGLGASGSKYLDQRGFPKLFPVKELSEILEISESSCWNHIKNGKISVVRICGRTFVSAEEVMRIKTRGTE